MYNKQVCRYVNKQAIGVYSEQVCCTSLVAVGLIGNPRYTSGPKNIYLKFETCLYSFRPQHYIICNGTTRRYD